MFPVLRPSEVERLRRFGKVRSYAPGEALAKAGEAGHGLAIVLAGTVEITRRDGSASGVSITTHRPGAFMGELAQLSGRPALVDAYAQEPVDALIIPPDRLRALLIAEAELGERIMRALTSELRSRASSRLRAAVLMPMSLARVPSHKQRP